jgi:ketosteroid isomerase-like protein
MSRENVELARRFYDAVNRRDLDALLALVDDEVELISILVSVDGGYHGLDGFRRWWADVFDTIPDYTIAVGDVRDLGDTTIAPIRLQGHGSGSGAPIDQPLWQTIEWSHEKALHVESFRTEEDALRATERTQGRSTSAPRPEGR